MSLVEEFEVSYKKNFDNDQLEKISSIYLEELPQDILPNFGKSTVKKYFELMLKNNSDIITVEKNSDIVGFIVLNFKNIELKKIINLKDILKFLFNSIFNPKLLIRLIFQTFIKIKIPEYCSEIHAFAVTKKFSSEGAGKILINEAELISKKKGCGGIFTKTHNEKLFKYYEREKNINLIKKYNIFNKKYYNFYWDI